MSDKVVDTNKPVFSFSRFKTYMTCPSQYKFIYLDKAERTSNIAMTVGTSVHWMAEQYVNYKIAGEEPDIQAIYDDAKKEWDKDVKKLDETLTKGESLFHLTQAYDLFDAYMPILQDVKPLHAERHAIFYPEDKPYGFQGVIDRIDEVNGQPAICDIKTSSKKPYRGKGGNYKLQQTHDLQLAAYRWMAKEELGIDTKVGYIDYIVKGQNPTAMRVDLEISDELMESTIDMFDRVYKAIEAGFFPPNRTCSVCSPKYCAFWTACTGLPT